MAKSPLFPILLILAMTIISAGFTYFRASVLTSPEQIVNRGFDNASRDTALFYAMVATIVGIVGFFVFRNMYETSPESAERNFLLLAVGIGVVLEILGAITFKMRGLPELSLLHITFIAGYGWLLPKLLMG